MVNDFKSDPDAEDRRRCVARAQAWTARQAQRLGVSPEEIDATIRRGWLPREIERAHSVAELLGGPQ